MLSTGTIYHSCLFKGCLVKAYNMVLYYNVSFAFLSLKVLIHNSIDTMDC